MNEQTESNAIITALFCNQNGITLFFKKKEWNGLMQMLAVWARQKF